MITYKCVYFDIRGIFEGVRLLLHYSGQKFEDIRLSGNDFAKIKPSLFDF